MTLRIEKYLQSLKTGRFDYHPTREILLAVIEDLYELSERVDLLIKDNEIERKSKK